MRAASIGGRHTTAPALRVRDVSKAYRRRAVLDGACFHVDRGESVAIVGENGAGKSTLLKVCAGLAAVDVGTVDRSGRIGYCPQEPGLVELLTAEQHLLLFGTALGLSRREARTAGGMLLDSFGLAERHTTAKELSGGSRQKLNLALALLGDPAVLLLDEPYQGFDLGSYLDFWSHVAAWRDAGRAVVVVTHLLTELDRVDRVVEVSGGLVRTTEGA